MQKIILVFLVLSLCSCSTEKVEVADFAWLEGNWTGTSDDLQLFEKWEMKQGTVLNGEGGGYVGKDTAFIESIKIEQRAEALFYVVSVKGNSEVVDFKFTGFKKDSAIFENPQHDFPKRIVYFQLPDNKMYAFIDGVNEGKYAKMEFSYQRVK